MMDEKQKKLVIYIHGKGGSASGSEFFIPLFPDSHIVGFDYKSETPQQAQTEFTEYYDTVSQGYDSVSLIADSIGAFFAVCSLTEKRLEKVFFISPVVNMEQLILDRMLCAGIREDILRERKEIVTPSGESFSWDYLEWVRNHPVLWEQPTVILYGSTDHLQSFKIVQDFAENCHADLTVMKNGEHWFHTEEQLRFLADWIKKKR